MIAMLVGVLLLVAPYLAWPAEYDWSKVRVGGKEQANTWAKGTNDAGWIVGNYQWRDDPTKPVGAFLFRKNTFIEFVLPGAEEAESLSLADIGKSSTIVGTYVLPPEGLDEGDGTLHAFLYRHGLNDHSIIDVPGAFWTFPFKVNDTRQVAIGFFAEPGPGVTTWGAAVYDYATNTHTPVTVFGDTIVAVTGINNHGDLTGTVDVPVDHVCGCNIVQYAFVKMAGQDQVLVPPDWAQLVWPNGINDHSIIAGTVLTQADEVVGFRVDLTTGVWEEIRHPTLQDGWALEVTDLDNQGRMTAIAQREADGYTESWWVRPKTNVARR
jgi:hypothetical protein